MLKKVFLAAVLIAMCVPAPSMAYDPRCDGPQWNDSEPWWITWFEYRHWYHHVYLPNPSVCE